MNSWKNKYSSSTKYTNVKTYFILQIDIEIYIQISGGPLSALTWDSYRR